MEIFYKNHWHKSITSFYFKKLQIKTNNIPIAFVKSFYYIRQTRNAGG